MPSAIEADAPSEATRTHAAFLIWFWIVAALGPVAASTAWIWYGFAQEEAQSEQGKAISAGTTMAGFAEVLGGVPLVIAHLVGLIILAVLGRRALGWWGLLLALAAVVAASLVGVGAAQLLYGGELFELGIGHESVSS